MKKVESIWAELSAKQVENPQEVELSEEQKLELASLEDFAKYERELKQILSEVKAADDKYNKLRDQLRSIRNEYEQAARAGEKIDAMMKQSKNEMSKAAMDMGLDPRPIAQAAQPSVDLYNKILRGYNNGIRQIGRV